MTGSRSHAYLAQVEDECIELHERLERNPTLLELELKSAAGYAVLHVGGKCSETGLSVLDIALAPEPLLVALEDVCFDVELEYLPPRLEVRL